MQAASVVAACWGRGRFRRFAMGPAPALLALSVATYARLLRPYGSWVRVDATVVQLHLRSIGNVSRAGAQLQVLRAPWRRMTHRGAYRHQREVPASCRPSGARLCRSWCELRRPDGAEVKWREPGIWGGTEQPSRSKSQTSESSGHQGGLHFYRVHNTKNLTVSLTLSAHAGSTDSPLGRAEQPYDRAPRGQPIGCRL